MCVSLQAAAVGIHVGPDIHTASSTPSPFDAAAADPLTAAGGVISPGSAAAAAVGGGGGLGPVPLLSLQIPPNVPLQVRPYSHPT